VTPKPLRCSVCSWPLAATAAEGCVEGNCSMRPVPRPRPVPCAACGGHPLVATEANAKLEVATAQRDGLATHVRALLAQLRQIGGYATHEQLAQRREADAALAEVG
jgi:hypothetical protein